jgi:hypothetical protein
MGLCSSRMFISVILSAAPPRRFQNETFEREVEVEPPCGRLSPAGEIPSEVEGAPKDPEDFLSIHTASGSSHDTRLLFRHPYPGFLSSTSAL